ncbi:MAG TPA: hypothetical protein VF174_06825, partial [Micromonosporaceae bacterium]
SAADRVPARQPAGTRRTWANIAAATVAARTGWPACAGGCGWPLDPAAAAGVDGTPAAFDRHPGCESIHQPHEGKLT